MTNLEENMEVLRYLNGINPDEFKDNLRDLIYKKSIFPKIKINF